jgi:hypothetical protein
MKSKDGHTVRRIYTDGRPPPKARIRSGSDIPWVAGKETPRLLWTLRVSTKIPGSTASVFLTAINCT